MPLSQVTNTVESATPALLIIIDLSWNCYSKSQDRAGTILRIGKCVVVQLYLTRIGPILDPYRAHILSHIGPIFICHIKPILDPAIRYGTPVLLSRRCGWCLQLSLPHLVLHSRKNNITSEVARQFVKAVLSYTPRNLADVFFLSFTTCYIRLQPIKSWHCASHDDLWLYLPIVHVSEGGHHTF